MKWYMAMALVLIMSCGVWANGVTVWGLTETELATENKSVSARVGYQWNYLEPFIGSTWTGLDEAGEPQIFSVGIIAHGVDLVDPNSPVPVIPDLLSLLLNEDVVVEPYVGFQASIALDDEAGFTGMLTGLKTALNPDASAFMVWELQYNNNLYDLGSLPENEFVLNVGLRFYFD